MRGREKREEKTLLNSTAGQTVIKRGLHVIGVLSKSSNNLGVSGSDIQPPVTYNVV